MTETEKKRGRPSGTSTKVKLKHNPKTSREDFLKKFKGETEIGIYGIDEYTKEIVEHLWNNPEISFLVTDNNQSRLDNANRYFGQRSFSMYRWEAVPPSNFIETPQVGIILVSKDCYDHVKTRPNPYNVKLILLEEI